MPSSLTEKIINLESASLLFSLLVISIAIIAIASFITLELKMIIGGIVVAILTIGALMIINKVKKNIIQNWQTPKETKEEK